MKKITFKDDPHRQRHFDHFRKMASPHFGITAEVDISEFLQLVRESPTLRFTPALVYLITRAALEVPSFTWRIRGEEVVAHDTLRPSFAVPTKRSSVFSFCTVPYEDDPLAFHAAAIAEMERMKEDPSFEDEPGADDYLFLSTFPWATFTSVQHAMPGDGRDSVPRIVWGKYRKQVEEVDMPVAVQAHHALVDGRDLGEYYRVLQNLLKNCKKVFTASGNCSDS
ncbi:CatA-like O-acetyltransferase [Lewinella sp. 4G2]|uniref:CatA-like O-acetyltransferase n=1 Tax=Lewinella sp. 4G2 TaxID=1803372 RepID=UPI0007B4C445|nr:CatA-like O-acetyltransferase [Lewinella sp. 4G2]OAV44924.1 chloramphenicol acetyltransferase [Lewinella sp. 4G2]